MRIVEFLGGLGNQMFQYVLFLKLQKLYKDDVKMDIDYYIKADCHNGFELDKIFNIQRNFSNSKEAYYAGKNNVKAFSKNFILRLYYKWYYKWQLSKYAFSKATTEGVNVYFEEVYDPRWQYYSGYWQNVGYFNGIEDKIKNAFRFPELDDKNKMLTKMMGETQSVSLHIRRGDYLLAKNSFLQNICTDEYYKNAIKYMEDHVENPHFFVFSNDIDWCKNSLCLPRVTFVEGNEGVNSYKDMQLMSMCKNNIIANSSFSWWGAWLNDNKDKIICAPNKWYSVKESVEGECPKEWIRIPIV